MHADYDLCERIARTRQCADCRSKSRLVTRWNGPADSWEVRCGVCGEGERFAAVESLTARWRRDPESVPITVANKLERKYGVTPMTDQALVKLDKKEMQQRINGARFDRNLSAQEKTLLAEVAVAYGLDPLLNELIVYESRPYVTIDGLVRVAHRTDRFAGVEDRPMTEDEKAAYGYTAPVCWIARVYRNDWKVPATGTGTADAKQPYRGNVIEKQFPQRMARVRAIRQALKLAFPNVLPFQSESADEHGIRIDRDTGEIIDTTASVVSEPVSEPASVEPAEGEPQAEPVQGGEAFVCADCQNMIFGYDSQREHRFVSAEELANLTLKNYERQLCLKCLETERQKRAKKAS